MRPELQQRSRAGASRPAPASSHPTPLAGRQPGLRAWPWPASSSRPLQPVHPAEVRVEPGRRPADVAAAPGRIELQRPRPLPLDRSPTRPAPSAANDRSKTSPAGSSRSPRRRQTERNQLVNQASPSGSDRAQVRVRPSCARPGPLVARRARTPSFRPTRSDAVDRARTASANRQLDWTASTARPARADRPASARSPHAVSASRRPPLGPRHALGGGTWRDRAVAPPSSRSARASPACGRPPCRAVVSAAS